MNESFLDSATLKNVVSLARNIGYVPRSRTAAKAVSFSTNVSTVSSTATLQAGLVCTGNVDNTSYTFAIPEDITTSVKDNVATFNNIDVYQGIFLSKEFTVDTSINQNLYLITHTLILQQSQFM